jgi:mono/diheme cytochrome c family protein
MSGQLVKADESGKPLDQQKSAPIQVIPREYDLAKLTHAPKVPENVFRGRVLWLQKCAFCHDGLGQPTYKTMGPWLDQDLVKTLTDDVVKILIKSGTARMPAFKEDLSAAQLDNLVDFLKTVPASDAPTPAQLAGRSEGGNSD